MIKEEDEEEERGRWKVGKEEVRVNHLSSYSNSSLILVKVTNVTNNRGREKEIDR